LINLVWDGSSDSRILGRQLEVARAEVKPMRKNRDKTVLLIENDTEQVRIIRAMFDDQGSHSFKLTHIECFKDAETYLSGHRVDIVVLDLSVLDLKSTDPDALHAVRRMRVTAPHVSIVLLSSPDDEPKAIRAIHEGAQDYLIKGQIEARRLMQALGNAVERTTNEEILINEKDLAQATLNCIADAVISTDMSGNITFFNPVAGSMMGWPLKEASGRHLTEVFRIVDATTRKPILDPMAKAASENVTGNLPLNCLLIHRDGHEVFIEDSVAPVHDREGAVTGAVIVFRDVSVARAQSEQITHLAEHDFLTGLPNRLLFSDRVGQANSLARRHRGQAAVLFLDLDGFKQFNDSLGQTMAVNVSGVQFQSEDFLDGLFAALSKSGMDPGLLELDLTESVLMRHPERTAIILKSLSDRGVQVSVDNFGTGNSRLSNMQKLPLKAVKIDRSFVRQITTIPGGTAAVEAFIDMARSLHLRVIAQGVEAAEDLEFLWEHDCDEAQGNFFSPPVPPDQLTRLFQPN